MLQLLRFKKEWLISKTNPNPKKQLTRWLKLSTKAAKHTGPRLCGQHVRREKCDERIHCGGNAPGTSCTRWAFRRATSVMPQRSAKRKPRNEASTGVCSHQNSTVREKQNKLISAYVKKCPLKMCELHDDEKSRANCERNHQSLIEDRMHEQLTKGGNPKKKRRGKCWQAHAFSLFCLLAGKVNIGSSVSY